MSFDILFLASKDTSTKGLIFKALIVYNSLSNAKLQTIFKKEFGKRISYQAIRQALLEMLDENILEKKDKEYLINKDWIQELKETVKLIDKSILKREDIRLVDKKTTQINLKNLYELGHFVLYSLEQKYFDLTKDNNMFMQINHLWIPFGDHNKRERLKQIFTQNSLKVIVKSRSAGDCMLNRWYKKYVTSKLGVSYSSDCDYIVHGDTVVQIYMNPELKAKMDKVYSLKSFLSIFKELTDMTFMEYGIQIVITRNSAIAEQIKTNIISLM